MSIQKESWRDEYRQYHTIESKITILRKRIDSLQERLLLYENMRSEFKEAANLYVRKWKKKRKAMVVL